jgi:hypothetical protein
MPFPLSGEGLFRVVDYPAVRRVRLARSMMSADPRSRRAEVLS